MTARITCSVMPGEIVVNDGAVVFNVAPNVQEWHFDLASKYAEIQGIMGGDTEGVCLGATKRTMHVNESKRGHLTVIEFQVPRGWELLIADCSRYTCRVILVKVPRNRRYRIRHWTKKAYPT